MWEHGNYGEERYWYGHVCTESKVNFTNFREMVGGGRCLGSIVMFDQYSLGGLIETR